MLQILVKFMYFFLRKNLFLYGKNSSFAQLYKLFFD